MVKGEVKRALKKRKGFKTAGMNGIVVEMFENVTTSIVNWLLIVFNICMESGVVPENLKAACIVLIYKGKVDVREYANYRKISILRIPGMIHGRILIR